MDDAVLIRGGIRTTLAIIDVCYFWQYDDGSSPPNIWNMLSRDEYEEHFTLDMACCQKSTALHERP